MRKGSISTFFYHLPGPAALALALALAAGGTRALAAPTVFGSLSNFDAVNNTGGNCNGFEIELDGISPSQVSYTFGSPYNRYGNPTIRASGANTLVDYAATFTAGAWSTYTQPTTAPITTGGHQFWTGGDPNYPLKGPGVPGDHFGLGLTGTAPTNTVYHWLVGDTGGHLTQVGTNVQIPVPAMVAAAPVVNQAAPAAVQVVVPAPPKEVPSDLFGPAIWVKVFTAEQPAHPVALDDLLVGNAAVSDAVETEWVLIQLGKGPGFDNLDSGLSDLNVGAEAVTRRYEFYKYQGDFSIEGEATSENAAPYDAVLNPTGYDPVAHLKGVVGDFTGSQNVALNLAAIPEPASLALLGVGALALLARRRR